MLRQTRRDDMVYIINAIPLLNGEKSV
jgi:hypothetical protein